jgi:tetratricopeptide (TPR) repeat protein
MSIAELNRAIESGDLEGAREIFGPLSRDITIPEETRARSAFRLSVALRNTGDFAAAEETYRAMEGLGSSEEVAVTRARTAFNLFESYRKGGRLEDARAIAASMGRLPQTDEIKLYRAMAAVNLVQSYAEEGDEKAAAGVYGSMAEIGSSEELNTVRVAAASHLLEAYEARGDYESAQRVFDSLIGLGVGDSEDVSAAAASAAVVMARICVKAGKIEEAKAVYRLLGGLVRKFSYLWEKNDEVFSIIYEATGDADFEALAPET